MARYLRLAPPGQQFGSADLDRKRLTVIALAIITLLALSSAGSARADASGSFCGSQSSPRSFPANSGCTLSTFHDLYYVGAHSTLSYAYVCAVAKGNPDGSGSNNMPRCVRSGRLWLRRAGHDLCIPRLRGVRKGHEREQRHARRLGHLCWLLLKVAGRSWRPA